MAKLVLDEPKTKPKLVLDEPEKPDFGMIALPREKLPGVWDYNRQLDSLLGDPDKNIENFMPLDVRYNFGRIIGMTEKPDETKDRMANSLYYSIQLNIPPGVSYNLQDAITKQKYGMSLSPKETRSRLADEHYEKRRQYYRENFEPASLFGNAFLQSLAGKPAMAIRGTKVYTPGEALGFDWFLTKTSEYLENLRSKEKMTDVEAAAAGKLWPIDRGASWYQIDPKLLPETINAWSATVGDQIPIMLMTLTGRAIGKVAGKPIGVGVGGLYALITGGPEPTDVVVAPVIAKVTEKVVEHLSGAAPLIAMEAGGFMDRANAIGLDTDIAEKYARPYGLGSGAIEYSQWLWNLKAFKMLSPKVKMSIMKKVLIEIGGATWEGIEELSQQGLENFLIGKAIEEQKARTPEYDVEKPETWAGGKRAFGIGLGVSLIVRLPGHAYTTIRSRKLAEQIQEQTGATKAEADIAVEAMSEGGRIKQGVIEVIAEQRTKQEAKQAEKQVPIEEMPDEQLEEKFRATKFTEPEWKPLYEEIVRRREVEKPPTVPTTEPQPTPTGRKAEIAPVTPEGKVDKPIKQVGIFRASEADKKYNLDFVRQIQEAKDKDYLGTLGDFLKGEKVRELYKNALDTPIFALTKPIQEGKRVDLPEDFVFAGMSGTFRGKQTIFVNPKHELFEYAIEDTILEEASHILRALKGRKIETPDLANLDFDKYREFLSEETADKMVKFAKSLKEEPVAKPEAGKPKTLQEMSDAELLEKRKPITAIDKKRRKPQQIKELQTIEDELVSRHQIGKSDISEKTRSKQVKETAETIKDHDLYKDAEQALSERYQTLPLKTYSIARNKADIPGEVKDYIGKPGEKGYKGYLWKYLTTIEETPSAMGYDEALDNFGGRPGDVGEFIARLDEVIQQQKGVKGVLNQVALDEAVATGEPYIELLAMKYEMLKEGFDAQEINDTIKKWAQDNEVDPELIEKDYVPVEGKQDVRTKQEILRELERENQKVERKTQRPSLEEAAIRKATEIVHKTKEAQYVYERTGKDAGLFAVSKKPPAEGAYKKITPPKAGELKGEVTEGYAGFTPEELKDVKKLRQKIHAIAINKGLTKKALSELKLKHTGYRRLTGKVAGKKISLEQLQNLLKAVQKARPKKVGYKDVITRKTEKKIQSLKENLIKKTQMTEKHFKDILEKEIHGKEPKYIDAKNFITEKEGRDIIRRTLDESKIIELTESFEQAIRKNAEIAEQVKSLDSRIEKAPKRDPYSLESMRYYNQQAEIKTGAPIFTAYIDLIDTHLEVTKTRTARLKNLENAVGKESFKNISRDEAALQRVSDYISAQSTQKERPATPKDITNDEIKVAKDIQAIAKEYRLKARFTKFYLWWSTGQQSGPHPLADYDRYKTEINKAVDILESKGTDDLTEYLKTQEWGVIKSGYEPLEHITNKIRTHPIKSTTVGKGHVEIRTDIEYHKQERNILQRLSAYMRQIDMLYSLSPKINAYVRLFDDNASKFSDWDKIKSDIEIFLRNLKRYNIEGGFFERMIARAYSQAMRVIIMPSPVLAYRNLHQNFSFETDKSILIDPRNTNLTDKDIEYLETYVLQTRAMVEEYFMVGEKPLPGLKFLTKLIDKVKIYPWSDIANRHWSFWAKTNQVDRALTAESIKQMMTEAKFEDMKELEQRRALAILARDGKEAMTQYVGRVHVDDIHFLYERSQRSPAEMTSLGKIVGNLMLFPRAYGEKLAHAANKTLKGKTYEEQWRGLKTIFAVVSGGLIVGSVYMKVTGRKRNPYNPLDILSFRPGGLAWGSIEAATDIYANILSAAKGDSRALAALTVAIPRAADMFIPFYDYALRGYEALTDQKNIDRKALRQMRMMIDKEYKIRGGAYKVNRNALEKWQYFLSGPSAEKEEKKGKPRKVIE